MAGRIEADALPVARRRAVHNDLLALNFIDDGERTWIVDWEYAGMGDAYFDLANFAVNNELDEAGERRCSTPTEETSAERSR